MRTPATHYARSGDASIAYQTLGDGDCDLVVVTGPASHLERCGKSPARRGPFAGWPTSPG